MKENISCFLFGGGKTRKNEKHMIQAKKHMEKAGQSKYKENKRSHDI